MSRARVGHLQSEIRNLLFDFGGTLDSEGLPWKERFFRLWRREGEEVSRDRFDRAFYAADDALVGALPDTLALSETVGRLARGVGEKLQTRDASLPGRVAALFCEEAHDNLARSAAILERWSRRFRIAVVSNFYGNLAAICQEAGIGGFLSAAVDSAAVGCCKPDPGIFRAALARLEAGPAESVFVGDSPERDMAGARGVGMRHVLLAARAGGAARKPCCPDDLVISRLEELEEMLR